METSFLKKTKEQLHLAAVEYAKMIGCTVVVESDDFQHQRIYRLRFSASNFLHLTGVLTGLKTHEFFEKCLNNTITCDEFSYNEYKNKTNIKKKLSCLCRIGEFFNQPIYAQEFFVKNKVACRLATADESFTIGFANGNYCLWPQTILSKNHLDKSKTICLVNPVVLHQ